MANRPPGVPEYATVIPPGQTFGPGIGVQQATLVSIEAQVSHQNDQKMQVYAQGMKDWTYNAQWAVYAHQPVPPPPVKPQIATMQVVYAEGGGNVVAPPLGADGLHYAWTWETYE